jgi:ParB-like chromosome segregation protein Spo0J
MARRIELWPVDRLIPYARNPRTHSEEQVAQIAASIAEFGFCNPILVDSRDGIIAGHGRLLAAKKLGLSEVPVIILDHLTEAQRRALVIADNKLAENAGWDEELLKQELVELKENGFGLDVIGFSDEQIADLLGASEQPEEQPEAADDEEGSQANIIVRLSIPASVWLGNRQAIIDKLEALGKKYLWDYRVDE